MFQVLTGDSWAVMIARPLFGENVRPTPKVALFFVSYIIVAGTFVLNVVVAVMLDEFITAVQSVRQAEKDREYEQIIEETMHSGMALDPLLAHLINFSSMDDLQDQIVEVYRHLDCDDSGGLGFEELRDGLRLLNLTPRIHFSEEDFETMTNKCQLLNARGEIDSLAFQIMVKGQLKLFMQRHIGARMNAASAADIQTETILLTLKALMFAQHEAAPPDNFSRTSSGDLLRRDVPLSVVFSQPPNDNDELTPISVSHRRRLSRDEHSATHSRHSDENSRHSHSRDRFGRASLDIHRVSTVLAQATKRNDASPSSGPIMRSASGGEAICRLASGDATSLRSVGGEGQGVDRERRVACGGGAKGCCAEGVAGQLQELAERTGGLERGVEGLVASMREMKGQWEAVQAQLQVGCGGRRRGRHGVFVCCGCCGAIFFVVVLSSSFFLFCFCCCCCVCCCDTAAAMTLLTSLGELVPGACC